MIKAKNLQIGKLYQTDDWSLVFFITNGKLDSLAIPKNEYYVCLNNERFIALEEIIGEEATLTIKILTSKGIIGWIS